MCFYKILSDIFWGTCKPLQSHWYRVQTCNTRDWILEKTINSCKTERMSSMFYHTGCFTNWEAVPTLGETYWAWPALVFGWSRLKEAYHNTTLYRRSLEKEKGKAWASKYRKANGSLHFWTGESLLNRVRSAGVVVTAWTALIFHKSRLEKNVCVLTCRTYGKYTLNWINTIQVLQFWNRNTLGDSWCLVNVQTTYQTEPTAVSVTVRICSTSLIQRNAHYVKWH